MGDFARFQCVYLSSLTCHSLSVPFEVRKNDLKLCPIRTYDKKGGLTLAVLPPVTHFVIMRVEFVGSRCMQPATI